MLENHLRLVHSRSAGRQPERRHVTRHLPQVFSKSQRGGGGVNQDQIETAANDYVERVFFTVDFHVADHPALSHEDVDKILTKVHAQLVQAYVAGYLAGSGGSEAA